MRKNDFLLRPPACRPQPLVSLVLLACFAGCAGLTARPSHPPISWTSRDLFERGAAGLGGGAGLSALAFDSKGNFHIVFQKGAQLYYLTRLASAGQQPAPEEGILPIPYPVKSQGSQISVNLDNLGRPHILYFGPHGLQYILGGLSGWSLGLITDQANIRQPYSFSFDPQGFPALLLEHQKGGLLLMKPALNAWAAETADLKPEAREGSLACLSSFIDDKGLLHAAYIVHYRNKATLWYTRRSGFYASPQEVQHGPGFTQERVQMLERGIWEPPQPLTEFSVRHISSCRIAWRAPGEPVYAWTGWKDKQRTGREKLVWGQFQNRRWKQTLLKELLLDPNERPDLSLALGTDNSAHIVLHETGRGFLTYYNKPSFMGVWTSSVIGAAGASARRPVLALDPGNKPWILFEQDGSLKLSKPVR